MLLKLSTKHKRLIAYLIFACTVFAVCSQALTVFAVDGRSSAIDLSCYENTTPPISESSSSAVLTSATESALDGIFVFTNRGNSHAIMTYPSLTSNASLIHIVERAYDSHALLLKIKPFSGIPSMGLPSGTYMIEAVAAPNTYLKVLSDFSVCFESVGSFPTANMLWYITQNGNNSYRITPYLYSGKALRATVSPSPGGTATVVDYSSSAYMQWDFNPNYSWYSQKQITDPGWQSGIFSNAGSGAIALEDIIFDEGLFANQSLRYAIHKEGCHLTSIAMILANMDFYSDYRYDVRTATNRYIFSDPYVLAMANLNLTDWSTAADGLLSGSGNFSNPMLTVNSYIYDVFDISIDQIRSTDAVEPFPNETRAKAEYITEKLNEYPYGIILRFSSHSVVVVSSTYTDQTPDSQIDDCFIVFDAGKQYRETGCFVPLSDTGRTLSNVVRLYTVEKND